MPRLFIIIALSAFAMIAFAANSVIARMALRSHEIGPVSYTTIRLIAGALMLLVFAGIQNAARNGNWHSAIALLVYAGFFSLAYISLAAGTGALILFAAVQITMIGSGLVMGERMDLRQTFGVLCAGGGLIYLLSPGLEAPSLIGAVLMTLSGVGWGVYSLRGRMSSHPTHDTAGNFIRAAGLACGLAIPVLLLHPEPPPGGTGIFLAILSGAITSGLGYVIWYRALKYLSAIRAGVAQLSVPAIAALGGILFLSEPLSWRFAIAILVILGGVAIAIYSKRT